MTKQIRFMETVLRDGQQSQIATRMPTADMLPIIKTMDEAGFIHWRCGEEQRLILACVF